jgi:hypothetical protein
VRAKAAALKAIKSGQLAIQGQIDAWNIIDQANQTIGTGMSGFKKANLDQLTAGLHGAQKKAEEMKIAQLIAHGGQVPTGLAADGEATHLHLYIDGKPVEAAVTKRQRAKQKRAVVSRRGRFAGQLAY